MCTKVRGNPNFFNFLLNNYRKFQPWKTMEIHKYNSRKNTNECLKIKRFNSIGKFFKTSKISDKLDINKKKQLK